MSFTVRDYQDLLRLLNAHPEWREEMRRALLSDDFLALPGIVRDLAAAQQRTEERLEALTQRVDALAAAQQRTEERLDTLTQRLDLLTQRVDALAAAQQRTEERLNALTQRLDLLTQRVDALAAAQQRTEERLDTLTQRLDLLTQRVDALAAAQQRTEKRVDELAIAQKNTSVELGRLSAVIGASLEDEAGNVLATVMRQKGYRVLDEPASLRFDGDVDVVLPIEDAQGRRIWVLMESKMRLSRSDVIRWAQRVGSPEWRQSLAQAGCPAPYLVYVYAIRVDASAREAAREQGMGLLRGYGEEIAPAGEIG